MNIQSLGNGFYRAVEITPSISFKRPDGMLSALFTKRADGEIMIIRGNLMVSTAEIAKAAGRV